MPQISTYPVISIPALDDLLIGTDIGNFEETKNFKVGDIASLVGGNFVPYTGATGNVNLGSFGITANSFVKLGGTSLQFLKADGSIDSTLYTPQSRTITINGVTYDLSGNRSWEIGAVESLSTAGTEGASTLNEGVLNIPQYQPAGNYITQLSGEATGAGPGAAAVVLANSAVISKVLTGFNTLSGAISSSDSILQAFGKAQSQINSLLSGVSFRGVWNASTNTPTLTSGSGTGGHYYVVSVAGTTNLNGNASWSVGDWVVFNGVSSVWQRVPNSQLVSSVNGYTGAVSLTSADTGSSPSTRTLTINGTAFNLTADRSWTVGNIRSDSTYGNPSWITSLDWSKITGRPSTLAGYGITDGLYSTTTITINGVGYDLSANRTWSVGTVKSVAVSGPLTGGTITNTGTIGITQASSTVDGYLSAADWNMFNNKLASISATAPLSFTAGVISISQAGASASGFLSQSDWNTFNGKQDLLVDPITGSGTSGKLPIFTGSGILSDSIISYSANSLLFSYNSTSGNSFVLENTGIGSYSYAIVMDNYGLQKSTTHQYGPGNIVEVIGANQVRRVFENGNTVLGVQTVDNGNKLSIYGTLFVNNVNNSTVNTNKFLVHDSGVIKFRTSAEVFSEIGATRQITINGVAQDLSVDRSWSVGTVTSVSLSAPVGFAVSGSPVTGSGSLSLAFASGYSLPTVSSQASWDSAFNNTIVSAAVAGTTTKTLTLTQQDGGTVTASWTESGGGSAGGSDTQIQFNNSGSFGGSASLTWDGSTLLSASSSNNLRLNATSNQQNLIQFAVSGTDLYQVFSDNLNPSDASIGYPKLILRNTAQSIDFITITNNRSSVYGGGYSAGDDAYNVRLWGKDTTYKWGNPGSWYRYMVAPVVVGPVFAVSTPSGAFGGSSNAGIVFDSSHPTNPDYNHFIRALAPQFSNGTLNFVVSTGASQNILMILKGSTQNVLIGTNTDNGTDKLQVNGSIIAASLKITGGTSSQFLMANGTVTSSTQATALLDTFTSTLKGLVPAPGSAGSTKFLREDGTWVVPSGGGITGSGTVNRIPKFTSTTALGDSSVVDTSSKTFIRSGVNATSPPTQFGYANVIIGGGNGNTGNLTVHANSSGIVLNSINDTGATQDTSVYGSNVALAADNWIFLQSNGGVSGRIRLSQNGGVAVDIYTSGVDFDRAITAPTIVKSGASSSDVLYGDGSTKKITSGTAAPSGGSDGDIYLQYV